MDGRWVEGKGGKRGSGRTQGQTLGKREIAQGAVARQFLKGQSHNHPSTRHVVQHATQANSMAPHQRKYNMHAQRDHGLQEERGEKLKAQPPGDGGPGDSASAQGHAKHIHSVPCAMKSKARPPLLQTLQLENVSVASTVVKAGTTYRLVLHTQSNGALLGSIPLTTHYTLLVLSLKTDDGEKQGQNTAGELPPTATLPISLLLEATAHTWPPSQTLHLPCVC
jgi:hypothetical protein